MRYDNESGKGDHIHIGDMEYDSTFTTAEKLIEDFWTSTEELLRIL